MIIEAQAWSDEPRESYADVWSEGHYLVVVAVNEEKIVLMDPNHLGSLGYWTIPEFLDRWHDISAGKKRRFRTAMFLEGTPNPPPPPAPYSLIGSSTFKISAAASPSIAFAVSLPGIFFNKE